MLEIWLYTLDISGSPIELQWGSQKYPGYNLDRYVLFTHKGELQGVCCILK